MFLRPILLALLLTCLGCAPALTDARAAVNRVADVYASTEPALEKQRIHDGDACFDASPPGSPAVAPCLDRVRAQWAPVQAAVEVFYAALVAAQGTVGAAEAAAALGRQPSVADVLVVVGQAVDASLALQRAVEAMRSDRDIKPGKVTP